MPDSSHADDSRGTHRGVARPIAPADSGAAPADRASVSGTSSASARGTPSVGVPPSPPSTPQSTADTTAKPEPVTTDNATRGKAANDKVASDSAERHGEPAASLVSAASRSPGGDDVGHARGHHSHDRGRRGHETPAASGGGPAGPSGPRPPAAGARRPRRRRSPLWAKLLVGLGALVMVAGLGAIVLVQVGLNQIDHAVTQENLLGTAGAPPAQYTGVSINGPINILLVGSDLRPNETAGGHSDTIIIVHIPASHDKAYLISIPRDLGVRVPAFPKTNYSGGSNKINAAFTFGSLNGGGNQGGFQLLAETIANTFGIKFNGGAIVDFSGFKDILNKLGGVWMTVDETTYSIRYGVNIKTGKPTAPYNINPDTGVPDCPPGYSFNNDPLKCAIPGTRPETYEKGYQHLTPSQALDFVRARDGLVGTDYARQRHQQQFIRAVLRQAYSEGLSDPFKMESFVTSIGKALIFDRNGVAMTDWIFTLKGITPGSVVAIKTNDGQTVDYDGSAGSIQGSVQSLSSDSLDLLNAVKADKTVGDDNVGVFLQTHQDWIAGD